MKKTLAIKVIFLALLSLSLFSSCEKCEQCEYIIETNTVNAYLKCGGEANNYPQGFKEESRVQVGELCGEDRFGTSEYITGTIYEVEICSGVTSTIRGRLVCN